MLAAIRKRLVPAARRLAALAPVLIAALAAAGPNAPDAGVVRLKGPKAPTPGPKPKDQVNLTNEESRIMPTSSGGLPWWLRLWVLAPVRSRCSASSASAR